MHVALIGASGNAGSRILAELVQRGHTVTAIVRDPARVPVLSGVEASAGDVADATGLAALLAGHDAVVSAVPFATTDAARLIATVRAAGVPRYLVVGGAGSLEVALGDFPLGLLLIDAPNFPEAYKPEAAAGCVFLDLLRAEEQLDWTFLSPSAMFIPGERTGTFRLGTDLLLSNESGSSISFEDFAIALVDELEKPTHSRARFTIGY
ncbi:3-beta hydroxysteroid dehydrogenase [Rhodanobacter sp. Root480]|uniref:NAD(P)-dependent oxidoreductase n=1 Tax=Rhodanobacter sp. Root480 TaxID=1736542 RepID=UPI0006F9FF0C|nr:NAD(P)-dependent oxidoreductase [Rhodanobacter sp. Root480]KQX97708.1 3-beta hydroxysteroid dehydrogenase [Rhodanobacter sp. Root480]